MKFLLPLLLLILCGCRTATPVATLPAPTPPVPFGPQPVAVTAPLPPVRPAVATPDPKSRQQAQLIEALINQNEALTVRLAALRAAPPTPLTASVPIAAPSSPVTTATLPVSIPVAPDPAIAPNAEGVIDLAAIEHAGNTDEPVNPFAVRATPGEKTREVSLLVGGIILGKAPCAMVNERLVQAGESIEGFEVEHIDPNAVIVRFAAHRLRLPVSTVPTRVKISL